MWQLKFYRSGALLPYMSKMAFGAAHLKRMTLNHVVRGADEELRVRKIGIFSILEKRVDISQPSKASAQL